MKMDTSQFDSNGKLKNGVIAEYFRDGAVACVGAYIDGKKTGEWKYYLRNGLLKAIGNYVDGKMTGEWKTYDDAGNLTKTKR